MCAKVTNSASLNVPKERTNFLSMLAVSPNFFGNIEGSKIKPQLKIVGNTTYEEVTCLGYNPDTLEMQATFSIKQSFGYSGGLCTPGSQEYIRFYVDYHDGAGFIDQGSVAINVHDIPADKDCKGDSIFPLKYVATLKRKKTPLNFCDKPQLPTLRAILSWQINPPANSPGWVPVWGSRKDCEIQLKPQKQLVLSPNFPNLGNITLNDSVVNDLNFKEVSLAKLDFNASLALAKKNKVADSRFAFDMVKKMIEFPDSEITLSQQFNFEKAGINLGKLVEEITLPIPVNSDKANVTYEELMCLGLDYNTESLVATFIIKKDAGYSGDLCSPGSKEYVSFWIDWDNKCDWQYLNTITAVVHDLDIKTDHLCYTVSLPLDTAMYRKLCNTPNIVRVRSVLSWQTPPSTTNPNKLEFYGNRLDRHIQIKPGIQIQPGDVFPLFNIIGGIDVDHINSGNGLTTPGAFFAYNGLPVPTNAPFGGVIVLNGPSFVGHKYRIKVTNLSTGTFVYINNSFNVVGSSPTPPYAPVTVQTPDGSGFYNYLSHTQNTLSVLARYTPPTEDKYMFELEVQGVPGVFHRTILINNTAPDIDIDVNDNGDCTHYKKGDTITGTFRVFDQHISHWTLNSTWGGGQNGTSNTGSPDPSFSIPTSAASYPCGAVALYAVDKTIVNSQYVGRNANISYNICLRDK